jgi:hypothetical protein
LNGCQTTRLITICRIFDNIGECARKDKQFKLSIEQMKGFTAWDELDMQLLGSKLDQCEEDGKLPSSDKTLEEMELCEIGKDCEDIEEFFATDPDGLQKIKDKLDWCRR